MAVAQMIDRYRELQRNRSQRRLLELKEIDVRKLYEEHKEVGLSRFDPAPINRDQG